MATLARGSPHARRARRGHQEFLAIALRFAYRYFALHQCVCGVQRLSSPLNQAWGRETNERRVSTTYDPCMELPQQQILPHQQYAASDAAVSLRYQPRGSLYVLRSRNHQPAFPSMDVALTSQTRPNESRICRPIKLVLPLASDRTLARTLAPSAFVKLQALAR